MIKGLLLAGGRSARMGRDKALLPFREGPLIERRFGLLASVTDGAYVSVNRDQEHREEYRRYPLLVDDGGAGPLAGLLAAFRLCPEAAWLVLAVDMPYIEKSDLEALIAPGGQEAEAIAFYNPAISGPEPLCALYESAIGPRVVADAAAGRLSPRRLLEKAQTCLLPAPNPHIFRNLNTPADYSAAQEELSHVS